MDIEWLLSTLFDASLLSLEPPKNGGSFFKPGENHTKRFGFYPPRHRVKASLRFCNAKIHFWIVYLRQSSERCVMSESLLTHDAKPVSFAARLANSQTFDKLFRDGMALVEETAIYLDGPGREESRKLDRKAALAYSTESIRLTTHLMQLASWLLLHRAVKEGEMSLGEANKERVKVKLSAMDTHDPKNLELIPAELRSLSESLQLLHDKVRRIDAILHAGLDPNRPLPPNPVERQLELLKDAFAPENA